MASNSRGIGTRKKIVESVKAEIIAKGPAKTSISAITSRIGITRSLFYHYFADKEEAVSAALDAVIDDFVNDLILWDKKHRSAEINTALTDLAELLIHIVREDGPFREGLSLGGGEDLYLRFMDRTARQISAHFTQLGALRTQTQNTALENIEDTVYVLLVGLVALIRTTPNISASTVRLLLAQSLHVQNFIRRESVRK